MQLRCFGARVLELRGLGFEAAGTLAAAEEVVRVATRNNLLPFVTARRFSPEAMDGAKTISYELGERVPEVDVVYLPVGGRRPPRVRVAGVPRQGVATPPRAPARCRTAEWLGHRPPGARRRACIARRARHDVGLRASDGGALRHGRRRRRDAFVGRPSGRGDRSGGPGRAGAARACRRHARRAGQGPSRSPARPPTLPPGVSRAARRWSRSAPTPGSRIPMRSHVSPAQSRSPRFLLDELEGAFVGLE
jgi:hypothetical protein